MQKRGLEVDGAYFRLSPSEPALEELGLMRKLTVELVTLQEDPAEPGVS